MNCPVCDNVRMREVEKEGVLIDICPSCKGVWLDRGELEKIMHEVHEVRQPFNDWYQNQNRNDHYQQTPPNYTQNQYQKKDQSDYYHSKQGHYYKRKKKKSVLDMLGDIFD